VSVDHAQSRCAALIYLEKWQHMSESDGTPIGNRSPIAYDEACSRQQLEATKINPVLSMY